MKKPDMFRDPGPAKNGQMPLERCPSGRRCLTRNQVWRKSPWVRIPPSPLALLRPAVSENATRQGPLERCPSGRRCMIGNHVWGNPPRVRIPPSPLPALAGLCPDRRQFHELRQDRKVATVVGHGWSGHFILSARCSRSSRVVASRWCSPSCARRCGDEPARPLCAAAEPNRWRSPSAALRQRPVVGVAAHADDGLTARLLEVVIVRAALSKTLAIGLGSL